MSGERARTLRVLQIIAGLNIGGAEKVVDILVRTFDRERISVGVCCTKTMGVLSESIRTEAPDVELLLASSQGPVGRYLTPLAVYRRIAAFRPDVVHTHGTAALLHTGPLGMSRLLPAWVHTFHFGNYANQPRSRTLAAEAFLSRYPARLVAVSESQRASIVERLGIPADRIQTIINGVRAHAESGSSQSKRAELGFSPADVVVGTIAVMSEQKGVTYLLKAIRLLIDRGCGGRFLVVGGGPLEGALREEAQALGIGDRVVFTGWRQDGLALMSVLDVFVMSSLWEAMPMALLEAMAARRAIVATDVGENRQILDNGGAGVIVPARDHESLAAAIGDLVSSADQRRAIGEAAGVRHQANYSVNTMVGAYQALYASVAG